MSVVHKCDICGTYEPRSIRGIISENPDPGSSPLNKEKFYAFNLFNGEFCDECLYEIERVISSTISKMKMCAKQEERK